MYINGYFFNSFVEAGLYSSQTVRQILEGKHVRRGLQAHLTAIHKSALMHILEKQIQTCEHLANSFLESIEKKYQLYHEVHLVFDRYDVPMSLKTATRDIRTSKVGSLPVAYKIDQRTNIGHISMAKLLAHTQTKHELTVFLSKKFIEQSMFKERQSVAAYSNTVKATKFSVDDLASSQEEADTKLILHACHAARRKATTIDIFSPDTDVFILAIHHYKNLCANTNFITGKGANLRSLSIGKIYNNIGDLKAEALLGFHALSGADNTGCFSGKGKPSWWKVFDQSNDDVLNAFVNLMSCIQISDFKHF